MKVTIGFFLILLGLNCYGEDFKKIKSEKILALKFKKEEADRSLKCVKKTTDMASLRKCRIAHTKRRMAFIKKMKKTEGKK